MAGKRTAQVPVPGQLAGWRCARSSHIDEAGDPCACGAVSLKDAFPCLSTRPPQPPTSCVPRRRGRHRAGGGHRPRDRGRPQGGRRAGPRDPARRRPHPHPGADPDRQPDRNLPGRGARHNEPRLLFMTHMDTVPLCAGAKPERKGERIVNTARHRPGRRQPDRVCGAGHAGGRACRSSKLPHPPITFLFTVREESGLFGARHLNPADLGGPAMGFNFDGRLASDVDRRGRRGRPLGGGHLREGVARRRSPRRRASRRTMIWPWRWPTCTRAAGSARWSKDGEGGDEQRRAGRRRRTAGRPGTRRTW